LKFNNRFSKFNFSWQLPWQ